MGLCMSGRKLEQRSSRPMLYRSTHVDSEERSCGDRQWYLAYRGGYVVSCRSAGTWERSVGHVGSFREARSYTGMQWSWVCGVGL